MKSGTRKKTSAGLLAVSLAAPMLLAGCAGATKPDASGSSTPNSSTRTTAAPTTTSASPTSPASPTTKPNIPVAARAHTQAGAEAFVRYFYSQLNTAWSKPHAGLISALSATTCKTCAALEGSAAVLATKHQRYRGEVFAVGTIASIGESEILVVGEQPPGAVVDVRGTVIRSRAKAQRAKFIVSVDWHSGNWRIHEMKLSR